MPTPFSASIRPRPRKNGTVAYDVRYRRDGRSESISFDDSTGATKWANILRQVGPDEAIALLSSAANAQSPTVAEYAQKFIDAKTGTEPKTREHYEMYIRLHMPFRDYPIDAVNSETIAKWVGAQVDAGNASKSIKNREHFLASMFSAAQHDGLIKTNPCYKVKIPETVNKQEMVFLTADEFTELLGYIPAHYQPLVLLLASTGLRWGEATALKPSDIDATALTLRVSRAWKSSKSRGWYIGPPKTARSKRTVAIPDNLLEQLDLTGEWLFTNPKGNPVRQSNFFNEVWSPARNLANGLPAYKATRGKGTFYKSRTGGVWDRQPSPDPIGKMPRIHDLRHSHASWLIAAGVPMITVQRRLGHESIATTEKVYSHLSPDMLRRPADVIGSVLAGAMPELE